MTPIFKHWEDFLLEGEPFKTIGSFTFLVNRVPQLSFGPFIGMLSLCGALQQLVGMHSWDLIHWCGFAYYVWTTFYFVSIVDLTSCCAEAMQPQTMYF